MAAPGVLERTDHLARGRTILWGRLAGASLALLSAVTMIAGVSIGGVSKRSTVSEQVASLAAGGGGVSYPRAAMPSSMAFNPYRPPIQTIPFVRMHAEVPKPSGCYTREGQRVMGGWVSGEWIVDEWKTIRGSSNKRREDRVKTRPYWIPVNTRPSWWPYGWPAGKLVPPSYCF